MCDGFNCFYRIFSDLFAGTCVTCVGPKWWYHWYSWYIYIYISSPFVLKRLDHHLPRFLGWFPPLKKPCNFTCLRSRDAQAVGWAGLQWMTFGIFEQDMWHVFANTDFDGVGQLWFQAVTMKVQTVFSWFLGVRWGYVSGTLLSVVFWLGLFLIKFLWWWSYPVKCGVYGSLDSQLWMDLLFNWLSTQKGRANLDSEGWTDGPWLITLIALCCWDILIQRSPGSHYLYASMLYPCFM